MNVAAPGRGMLVGALAALTMVLGPVTTSEASSETISSYCSPTGDFCVAVTNVRHRAKLELQTFSFDSYSACLKGPGTNTCTGEIGMDANSDGVYSSRIDVARKFHPSAPGRYRASWYVGGSQIGKTLKFSLG